MKLARLLLWPLATLCLATTSPDDHDDFQRPPPYDAKLDKGSHGYYPVHPFITSPLTAPQTNFVQWSPDCNDGLHYFITPKGWSVSKPGPMILAGDGSMVWSEHFANGFGGQAYDLKVQKYQGEEFLTFWLGDDTVRGHGAGQYYMLNASYDIVHTISAANGKFADLHELIITPEATALMIVFEVIPADVRPLGRKFNDVWNQAIWNCLIQEVNIETGELVFEWRGSEHVNITQTYMKLDSLAEGTQENPFDPYHLNSVEKDELGNYLISARNPHAIIYIDGKTGVIIWTLGGKNNLFMDLSDGYALNFAWQHDARFVSPYAFPETYTPPPEKEGVSVTLLTMFDNAAVDWDYFYGMPYSRGLLLELTYPTPDSNVGKELAAGGRITEDSIVQSGEPREPLSKQDAEKVASINGTRVSYAVRVIHDFTNPNHVRSGTQGSVQLLPQAQGRDPKLFVGYGLNAVMTEYSSNGSVLCDVHFGAKTSWERGDVQSYRAYKFAWVGRPRTAPVAAVKGDEVLVSWNGATEVHSWLLQTADSPESDWTVVEREPRRDFETAVRLPRQHRAARYLRILAIDRDGQPCEYGVSNIVVRNRFATFARQRLGGSSVSAIQLEEGSGIAYGWIREAPIN
ncbi:hypothetical protein LTR36_004212 [Oleoguttula mirabilis]|uniref:ASST-domain-containing protein n=1 Tax=Oleoguttula mirabilis TaxID=1507867 RepID=A0AAV9JII2_9PEZI|nr:hypothetical protein LTR36_004212 [Oleoguttula mirabilis]